MVGSIVAGVCELVREFAGEVVPPGKGPVASRPARVTATEVQAAVGKLADPSVPLFQVQVQVQVLAVAESEIAGRAACRLKLRRRWTRRTPGPPLNRPSGR